MCWINITTVGNIVQHAPVVVVIAPIVPKTMIVGTLDMSYVAKDTITRHIKSCYLKEVVHTILEHHAMTTCTFGSIYHLPYLIER